MFAWLQLIYGVITGFLSLLKYFRNWKVEHDKAEAEKQRQEREAAVDRSVNANTDEEIWNEQYKIASNKPSA